MKQIFDWLREQIKDASFRPFNEVVVYEESVQNLINEAEAKWKSDCCIYTRKKYPTEYPHGFMTSCGSFTKKIKWLLLMEKKLNLLSHLVVLSLH